MGCRRRFLRWLIEPLVNHQNIAFSGHENVPNDSVATIDSYSEDSSSKFHREMETIVD